jgi:hypothetical protein
MNAKNGKQKQEKAFHAVNNFRAIKKKTSLDLANRSFEQKKEYFKNSTKL